MPQNKVSKGNTPKTSVPSANSARPSPNNNGRLSAIPPNSKTLQRQIKVAMDYRPRRGRGQVVQRQDYGVRVALRPPQNSPNVKTNELVLKKIILPKGVSHRPPTGLSGGKQGAHSVSWLLIEEAYLRAKDINLVTFIRNYLYKDWEALHKQQKFITATKNDTLNLHRGMFISLLQKYGGSYFTNLLSYQGPALNLYAKIQDTISDLFVAIQKGPLSIHMGFVDNENNFENQLDEKTRKEFQNKRMTRSQRLKNNVTVEPLYKQKHTEFKPENHGELGAKNYFTQVEQTGQYKKNDTNGKQALEFARSFLDLGGSINGIVNPMEKRVVIDELYSLLARAYPNVWERFSKDITHGIDKMYKPAKVFSEPKRNDSKKKGSALGMNSGYIIPKPVRVKNALYSAKVDIEHKRERGKPKYKSGEISMDRADFSVGRPKTKFGSLGQKAHTVAWTLTMVAMNRISTGQTVRALLEEMVGRWEDLKDQDWAYEIQAAKSRNTKEGKRMKDAYESIAYQLSWCNKAIKEFSMTDTQWVKNLQTMLSQYMKVYQTAPYTTQQSSNPTNHNEQDTKVSLESSERNYAEQHQSALNQMNLDNSSSGTVNNASSNILNTHERMASRMLDINLSALHGNVNDRQNQVAGILHKWINQMRIAYPHMWEKEKTALMNFARNYMNQKFSGTSLNNFQSKMDNHFHKDGVRAARLGDTSENGATGYNNGVRAFSIAIDHFVKNPSSNDTNTYAKVKAKEDVNHILPLLRNLNNLNQSSELRELPGGDETVTAYENGLNQIRNSPGKNQPNTVVGVEKVGWDDYKEGLDLARRSLGQMMPSDFKGAKKTGYQDVQEGYTAALNDCTTNAPMFPLAAMLTFSSYVNGVKMASSSPEVNQNLSMAEHATRAGYSHFMNGYNSGLGNILNPTNITPNIKAYQLGRQAGREKIMPKNQMKLDDKNNNNNNNQNDDNGDIVMKK